MATVADYKVLFDGVFELKKTGPGDDDHVLEFSLPNDLVHGIDLAKPVLAFIIRPVEETHVRIKVNTEPIFDQHFDPSVRRGYWEPFSGDILETGDNNKIRFHLDSGLVRFSKVVLWYQRSV